MTSRTLLRPTRRVLLLALMMLLTQMLAMMHGAIPAVPDLVSGHHETGVVHVGVQGAHPDSEAGSGASWIEALFSAHEDKSDCRLFEQVGRDALMAGIVIAGLHAAPVCQIVDLPRGEALARWAAFFEARGPPLL